MGRKVQKKLTVVEQPYQYALLAEQGQVIQQSVSWHPCTITVHQKTTMLKASILHISNKGSTRT